MGHLTSTLKRLSVYLLVYVILFAGFVSTGVWHYIDYAVYRTLYLDDPANIRLPDSILLIDLPYKKDRHDPTEYRQRLAELIDVIADRDLDSPRALSLDIWVASDQKALVVLEAAIKRLQKKRVPVYAAFDPDAGSEKHPPMQPWDMHATELYRNVLDGYGHTFLDVFRGVLSYETELRIKTRIEGFSIEESIFFLPVQIAMDLGLYAEPPRGKYVLPVGNEAVIESHTIAFVHPESTTGDGKFFTSRTMSEEVTPSFNDKIVLIGSVKEDQTDEAPQSGPQLVAWALGNELTKDANARQPLISTALVLGQILIFALFTGLIFALIFKYVPRLQTKPLLMACLAIGISAAGLATAAAAALVLNYVTPVGLTLFAITLSGIFAWRFALKFLVTGVAEGAGKYDAFISYSRQHSDWVVKNVYEPLKATRKADGSELSIFFDRAEIGLGEAFTAKYMWAIVDSRVFIAIFSDGYYARNHCRNEMDVAYKRSVEKRIEIVPISVTAEAVPEIYSHLNYVDAQADENFIEHIRRTLL